MKKKTTKTKTPAQLDREIADALSPPTELKLKDRHSGNHVWLTLRDGRVVGVMGSDPARYMRMTTTEARHLARYGGRGRTSHSTKSSSYDNDDARRFGRYAYRMEQTKAQALANAKAEGFGAHHLAAVEDGWLGERRDTVHGGFAGSSHATRRKQHGRRRTSHATKSDPTMFAVEIDSTTFDRDLPAGAKWRKDLAHLAEKELGRGRTYRRPAKPRYDVIEWTGYRAEVGKLLDWMEGADGITRYAEIFE